MTRQIVAYAGTIALLLMTGGPAWSGPSSGSSGASSSPSQSVSPDSSKDKSPDMKHYKDKMGQAQTPPAASGNPGVPGQKGPGATGSMGEESVGGGGPSGTSGLPPGKAPQFEGGNPSSKR
jgi:hypothetical protein